VSAAGGAAPKRAVVELGPTIAAIALLVALASVRYLPLATSDSLLPALMSTQRLTFYYWGQDRIANVVPLLAWPIRDPIWNFRFQMAVFGSAFFALVAQFAWYHLHATTRRATGFPLAVATLLAGVAVLTPLRAATAYAFVFEQVYALSLALFLRGARLVVSGSSRSRRRRVIGAVLIVLAVLLNPSVAVITPVMWVLDDERDGRQRRFLAGPAVVFGALAAFLVTSRVWGGGPDRRRAYGSFSLDGFADALSAATSGILGSLDLSVAAVLAAGCALVIAARVRAWPVRHRVLYVFAAGFGAGWLLLFTANEWVSINAHAYRYFFPLYAVGMLLVAAAVAEVVALVSARLERARQPGSRDAPARFSLAASALLACGVVAVASVATTDVHTLNEAAEGVETARALDLRLVAGDYWSTWPIVVSGRSAGLDLLGVAGRSDAIVDDIGREVRRSMDASGSVRALCPSLDLDQCASDLSYWTGRPWSVTNVARADPSVIDLEPVP
jgi:hypothetical protein